MDCLMRNTLTPNPTTGPHSVLNSLAPIASETAPAILRNQCFSVGFGIEERGSLQGKESANVLSSPFSRRSNRLFSSTDRSWRADVSCGRPSYTSRWPFDANLDFMTVSKAFFIESFLRAESRSRDSSYAPQCLSIARCEQFPQLFDLRSESGISLDMSVGLA